MKKLKYQSQKKQEAVAKLTQEKLREILFSFIGELCIVDFAHYYFNENANTLFRRKMMFHKHPTALIIKDPGYDFKAEIPWHRVEGGIIDSVGRLSMPLKGDGTLILTVTNDLRDVLLQSV